MSDCIFSVHMFLMCLEHSRNNARDKRNIFTVGIQSYDSLFISLFEGILYSEIVYIYLHIWYWS